MDNTLALITEDEIEELNKSQGITDQILWHNRQTSLLQALRVEAQGGKGELIIKDSLLLYSSRLVVPDTNNLCTDLIWEAYD